MEKSNLLIIILAILLIVSVSYIGYTRYIEKKNIRETEIFNSGALNGYTFAVSQIYQGLISCNPVPVTFNNTTINAIAIECLNQKIINPQQNITR